MPLLLFAIDPPGTAWRQHACLPLDDYACETNTSSGSARGGDPESSIIFCQAKKKKTKNAQTNRGGGAAFGRDDAFDWIDRDHVRFRGPTHGTSTNLCLWMHDFVVALWHMHGYHHPRARERVPHNPEALCSVYVSLGPMRRAEILPSLPGYSLRARPVALVTPFQSMSQNPRSSCLPTGGGLRRVRRHSILRSSRLIGCHRLRFTRSCEQSSGAKVRGAASPTTDDKMRSPSEPAISAPSTLGIQGRQKFATPPEWLPSMGNFGMGLARPHSGADRRCGPRPEREAASHQATCSAGRRCYEE